MGLFGEFPGRGKDECAGNAGRSDQESLQNGEGESGCLSRSCLGETEKITSGEYGRYGLFLDGCRGSIVRRRN